MFLLALGKAVQPHQASKRPISWGLGSRRGEGVLETMEELLGASFNYIRSHLKWGHTNKLPIKPQVGILLT